MILLVYALWYLLFEKAARVSWKTQERVDETGDICPEL